MRIVFCPADACRGAELIRVVGVCSACGKQNIVWMVRGHVMSLANIRCEYCKPIVVKKGKKSFVPAIKWSGSGCFDGIVVGANFPEIARAGDLVM